VGIAGQPKKKIYCFTCWIQELPNYNSRILSQPANGGGFDFILLLCVVKASPSQKLGVILRDERFADYLARIGMTEEELIVTVLGLTSLSPGRV
jgi:hypothetical protein